MPSLFRFLVFCALLAGLVLGAMIALDLFVDPVPREMNERVQINRLPQ